MATQACGTGWQNPGMGFEANVLEVMISTPGDTAEEVEAVQRALHGWNTSRAKSAQVVLLPRFWKTSAVPTLSKSGGQSVINSQLVDEADIVLVLFDSKLGQATDDAVSGTAEELDRAANAGKPVHVWFSDEPVDRQDLKEAARLQEFRMELEQRGLLGVYANIDDLAYKVRDTVEADVAGLGLSCPSVIRRGDQAMPRVHVAREEDRQGNSSVWLVLENKSQTVAAEQLEVDLGPWEHSVYREDQNPFDLPPAQLIRWSAAFSMADPMQVSVRLTWTESGIPQTIELPVTSA